MAVSRAFFLSLTSGAAAVFFFSAIKLFLLSERLDAAPIYFRFSLFTIYIFPMTTRSTPSVSNFELTLRKPPASIISFTLSAWPSPTSKSR